MLFILSPRFTEELTATKTELASLKEDYEKQQQDIEYLGESLDNLEQYSRKNSLEIHGIPEGAYQLFLKSSRLYMLMSPPMT